MDKKLLAQIVGFFSLLAAVLAIPQFYIQYQGYKSEHGGRLSMYFMNNEIHNNEVRNIYICVSNSNESLSGISITPIFNNSSEYSIKDFDLRYTLESESNGFMPKSNSLYEQIVFDNNSCMYKYQEKTLPQFSQTHEPFRLSSFPKVNSRYTLKAKATYSGAPSPYKYQVNVWIRVYPRKSNQSFEDWKMTCKQQLYQLNSQATVYDAFYASGDKFYHEFGSDFGPQYAASQNTNGTSQTKASTSQNTQSTPAPAAQAKTPTPTKAATSASTKTTSQPKPVATSTPVASLENEPLRIISWRQTKEDTLSYLTVTFNKPTQQYTYYAVATYNDKVNKGYSDQYLCGNNTNTIKHQLYNPNTHILYVCLPIEKDSLNQYVTFKDSEEEILWIHNNSDSIIMVEIRSSKYYYPQYYTINRNHSLGVHNSKSSDILSFKTYLVPRYEGEIREEIELKKRKRMEGWGIVLVIWGGMCAAIGFTMILGEIGVKELFNPQTWRRIDKQELLLLIGSIIVGITLLVLGFILLI